MECSTSGFPIHDQLPELAQTHVHQVDDGNQWFQPPVIPFSSSLQPFPTSGSFQMSLFFTSDGQGIGASAAASVLPMNIQDWSPLGWTVNSHLQHHSSRASVFQGSGVFMVQLSHPYMTTGKTITLTRSTFLGKVTSLLFNMLSKLVMAFLPRRKHL